MEEDSGQDVTVEEHDGRLEGNDGTLVNVRRATHFERMTATVLTNPDAKIAYPWKMALLGKGRNLARTELPYGRVKEMPTEER
ncbi:hypothetical protein KM043_007286 [Ampulex compressa]|nr:hypothetical protein KM043_007286 [Ampulex compressa]